MPVAVSLKLDERSVKETQHLLRAIPRAFPNIMRRGINRTVDMAATQFKRLIAERITAKKGEIAKGIGKQKATNSNFSGFIFANIYRLGLIAFPGTRQTKRGVTYRISKQKERKRIDSGFISQMPSGHRGVFLRSSNRSLPIKELRGPSIWQVSAKTPGLIEKAQKVAGEILDKNINHQIDWELQKWQSR